MAVTLGHLAKETSTTTGTGAYTLAGAVSGFRAFSAVVTPASSAFLYLTVTMGTEFEEGIYRLFSATELTRWAIIRSSNANAAVNWGAGEKTISCEPGVGGSVRGKHEFAGGSSFSPFADGIPQNGYGEGSYFVQTHASTPVQRSMFVCVDANQLAPVWLELTPTPIINYNTNVPARDSEVLGPRSDYLHPTILAECVVGLGFGGLAAWNNMVLKGAGWANDVGEYEDVISVSLSTGAAGTTDATPTKLTNETSSGDNQRNYLPIPINSVHSFKGRVTALATVATGGDCSVWDVSFVVKRAASGDPVFVGTPDVTMIEQDAGAAAWAVTVGIDTTNDGVYIEFTGEAATTIRALANLRCDKVAFA